MTPVSASSGLEAAAGEVAGEATGEAPGEAVAAGLVVATGELSDGEAAGAGEGLEGQRPQVAAQ